MTDPRSDSWIANNISRVKIKWYDTIFLLVGSVLAVVDPVTDILTLREFYLEDHKIWFGVGLAFVIIPSVSVSVFPWIVLITSGGESKRMMGLIPSVLFGWNPLSVSYTHLTLPTNREV